MAERDPTQQFWHSLLIGEDLKLPMRQFRHAFGLVPSSGRCKFCNAPFDGVGGPAEFSRLISRFFAVASKVMLRSRAWVDRLVGDQVIGMYIPFYVGADHERAAVDAAKDLLRRTGHADTDGPWIPLGVGVHTGVAFVGTVGGHDAASEDAFSNAPGLGLDLETRDLELKGKSEPVPVRVLTDYS